MGLQIYFSHWNYLKVLCGNDNGKLGTEIDFILGSKYLKKLTAQGGKRFKKRFYVTDVFLA